MNTKGLFIVFAFALLAASTMPAFAQSNPISDNVAINEIDTNPPGDDSQSISEWVELYNPTDIEIDIGGWEVASTTILKKTLVIPQYLVDLMVGLVLEGSIMLKANYIAF